MNRKNWGRVPQQFNTETWNQAASIKARTALYKKETYLCSWKDTITTSLGKASPFQHYHCISCSNQFSNGRWWPCSRKVKVLSKDRSWASERAKYTHTVKAILKTQPQEAQQHLNPELTSADGLYMSLVEHTSGNTALVFEILVKISSSLQNLH